MLLFMSVYVLNWPIFMSVLTMNNGMYTHEKWHIHSLIIASYRIIVRYVLQLYVVIVYVNVVLRRVIHF